MESLRKSRDFRKVIEGGNKAVLETITIFTLPNREGKIRLGVSVSRKSGGSVKRNRIKRRIKEAVRKNSHRLPQSVDMVVMARKGAGDASFHELERDICSLCGDKEEGR